MCDEKLAANTSRSEGITSSYMAADPESMVLWCGGTVVGGARWALEQEKIYEAPPSPQ
eukprot:gene3954-14451_t